jgi:hypothetical protein
MSNLILRFGRLGDFYSSLPMALITNSKILCPSSFSNLFFGKKHNQKNFLFLAKSFSKNIDVQVNDISEIRKYKNIYFFPQSKTFLKFIQFLILKVIFYKSNVQYIFPSSNTFFLNQFKKKQIFVNKIKKLSTLKNLNILILPASADETRSMNHHHMIKLVNFFNLKFKKNNPNIDVDKFGLDNYPNNLNSVNFIDIDFEVNESDMKKYDLVISVNSFFKHFLFNKVDFIVEYSYYDFTTLVWESYNSYNPLWVHYFNQSVSRTNFITYFCKEFEEALNNDNI